MHFDSLTAGLEVRFEYEDEEEKYKRSGSGRNTILTLAITLNFALLERLLQRRWVVTLGVACTMIAMLILEL